MTPASPRVTGVFTTMRHFPDSGDVGGIEIFIVAASSAEILRYFAFVQLAEGVPLPPVLVEATVIREEVRFVVPDTVAGAGTFVGRVTEKGLVGTFSGTLGHVELPRGRSYWQGATQ